MKPELDKAIAAANAHTRLERDEEYGGMICAECGFSLGALPIESDARFRHGMEAAALVLLAPYQARIKELEARIEKADRLAEAVDNTLGLWPGGDEEAHALTVALSEYRDETEGEK